MIHELGALVQQSLAGETAKVVEKFCHELTSKSHEWFNKGMNFADSAQGLLDFAKAAQVKLPQRCTHVA